MTVQEFRRCLHALGWSRQELGERLGVHRNTLTNWTKGRTEIPRWLAEYLRVMVLAKRVGEVGKDEESGHGD